MADKPENVARLCWLLRVQAATGLSALHLGLAAGALFLLPALLNVLVVAGLQDVPSREFYQVCVVIAINAGSFGYAAGFLAWALRSTRDDVLSMRELLRTDAAKLLNRLVAPLGRRAAMVAFVAGFLCWLVPNIIFGDLGSWLAGDTKPFNPLFAWGIPNFLALWLLLLYVAAHMVRIANTLAVIGARLVRVDLYSMHRLGAFLTVGQRLMLIAVGGISFLLVQGALLGSLQLRDWLLPVMLVLPLAVWLLVRPMWGIRNAIRAARMAELERLDAAIGYAPERNLAALSDPSFSALLSQRDRILAVSEWPVARLALWRIGFYVVIPPLAWVAAALVEAAVDRLM
ncbi:MAG: hypothetical protein R3E84_23095 [Pseudomonadales bacterium]